MKTMMALLTFSLFASQAHADFASRHPRRAEVNVRENRQEARIAAGVANGTVSSAQQTQFAADEAKIKAQEVSEVKANGGYLTRSQQQELNTELNTESQDIYSARHPASESSADSN